MNYSILILILIAACAGHRPKLKTQTGVIEDTTWYGETVETTDSYQLRLDLNKLDIALDIRGTGDTAWTYSATPAYGRKKPRPAGFGDALKVYDPHGEIFTGDLSFTNIESVVGERCDKIRNEVSFYFLTHPESVSQAVDHGFNLLSFSNNHSQDCRSGRAFVKSDKKAGPLMTKEALEGIKPKGQFIWNGVGEDFPKLSTKVMKIKGKEIQVTMGAISLLNWDIPYGQSFNYDEEGWEAKVTEYLKLFNDYSTGLKILSIHTQDKSGYKKDEAAAFVALKKVAMEFVEQYDGDIVFGHGPHSWGGVKMVEKKNGKKGVIFTSLGNFIHYGLGAVPDNYIARAIFDIRNLRIKQVHVIPFLNNYKVPPPEKEEDRPEEPEKIFVNYYDVKDLKNEKTEELLKAVHANFPWRTGTFTDHEKKKRGLYFATFD